MAAASSIGGDFIKRYVEIVNGREAHGRSRRRSTSSASTGRLLHKDQAANKLLAHLPGWKRVYGDDTRPSSSASASP